MGTVSMQRSKVMLEKEATTKKVVLLGRLGKVHPSTSEKERKDQATSPWQQARKKPGRSVGTRSTVPPKRVIPTPRELTDFDASTQCGASSQRADRSLRSKPH